MTPKYLDPQLRELVKKSVATLGAVIEHNVGASLYQKIEKIRQEMVKIRKGSHATKMGSLESVYKILSALTVKEQFYVAHSFGLMLEVMNVCENAYRTQSITNKKPILHSDSLDGIFYVVTAHPTESRSPENVAIFGELQKFLVESLKGYFVWHEEPIRGLIEKAWHTPITRQRKPQVSDEAEYIYSIVLNPIILESLIRANQEVGPIFLRSWVGGDKDGHPGVNAKEMVGSLNLSRKLLVHYLSGQLDRIVADLDLMKQTHLTAQAKKLRTKVKAIRTLQSGDAQRITDFRSQWKAFFAQYGSHFKSRMDSMRQIDQLLKVFPGLVIPLELRESSEMIILASQKTELEPIAGMLQRLKEISSGGNPRWYVRGLIISMCGEMSHIQAGMELVKRFFEQPKLPVIPLFEQESALRLSPVIVKGMLESKVVKEGLQDYWHNRLEIMLGYSDSAKEVGSLQSRLLISDTVKEIESLCRQAQVQPVFFHGSGGSVDRGGGSIQEQTAWLSRESLRYFKATVQGEMVERTFSSREIFRSGVDRLSAQISKPSRQKGSRRKARPHSKALYEFAAQVSEQYKTAVQSQEFLDVVQRATPYRFLSDLKLGSRPSRRGKVTNISNLRAIPWVLCWTQTRILFPVWWGTGTAWSTMTATQKRALKRDFVSNPLFRSYVKLLGFTLAKVELPIWEMYLRKSGLSSKRVSTIMEAYQKEYHQSVRFLKAVTGERNLLWYRPWLSESIQLRSAMIHPLNLLQMIVLKKRNPVLLRETVAGIANGMLTTG